MPTLPATIAVVRVNHAPTTRGRLWKAARDGAIEEVVSAIKDGCCTEESDDQVRYILSIHSISTWRLILEFLGLVL